MRFYAVRPVTSLPSGPAEIVIVQDPQPGFGGSTTLEWAVANALRGRPDMHKYGQFRVYRLFEAGDVSHRSEYDTELVESE